MYIDGFRDGSIRGGQVLTEAAFIVGANKNDNWLIQLAITHFVCGACLGFRGMKV